MFFRSNSGNNHTGWHNGIYDDFSDEAAHTSDNGTSAHSISVGGSAPASESAVLPSVFLTRKINAFPCARPGLEGERNLDSFLPQYFSQ